MGKHKFTPAERYAVFQTHGARCYLQGEPLDLLTMQVDHVIPEDLADKPDQLNEARTQLGLPDDFDVNSFENWLPACGPCNRRKSSIVWNPSPMVQTNLQIAAKKAPAARATAAKVVSDKQLGDAANAVLRALEGGELSDVQLAAIEPIVNHYAEHITPEAEPDILRLTPTVTAKLGVLSDDGRIRIVRGPYGVGGGPSSPQLGMRCSCGSGDFNGARCVWCGQLYDD